MEFLETTTIPASDIDLKNRLTIATLPSWCDSIEKILGDFKTRGEIYCVWGVFEIQREELLHGVRFTLPGCPYAMQWTVTTGHNPEPLHTVIHLTTNRTEHEDEFVDSIRKFMLDWKKGLASNW
jgi:hypothetical protein